MPESYYDQRQYWFKINTYASTEYKYALGKTFFCHACRDTQDPDAYQHARFLIGGNGYTHTCLGCAHFNELKVQSHIDDVKQLADWQRYGLASAMYAYNKFLRSKTRAKTWLTTAKRSLTMVVFASHRIKLSSTLDVGKLNPRELPNSTREFITATSNYKQQ